MRNIYLRGADVRGGINVSGAQLAADFDCAGVVVYRPDKVAIAADAMKAGGSVILRPKPNCVATLVRHVHELVSAEERPDL